VTRKTSSLQDIHVVKKAEADCCVGAMGEQEDKEGTLDLEKELSCSVSVCLFAYYRLCYFFP